MIDKLEDNVKLPVASRLREMAVGEFEIYPRGRYWVVSVTANRLHRKFRGNGDFRWAIRAKGDYLTVQRVK